MNDEQRQHVWTICAGGMQECIPARGRTCRTLHLGIADREQLYSMRNMCTCIMWYSMRNMKFNGGPGETANCTQ